MWWFICGLVVAGLGFFFYLKQRKSIDESFKIQVNSKAEKARALAERAKTIAAKSRYKEAADAATMAVNAANAAIVAASHIKVGMSESYAKGHILNLDKATGLAERATRVTEQIISGDFDEWHRFNTFETLRVCETFGEHEALVARFHMGAICLAEGKYAEGIELLSKCAIYKNHTFVDACTLLRNVYAAGLPGFQIDIDDEFIVDDEPDVNASDEETPDWGFLAEEGPLRFGITDMPCCIVEYPISPEDMAQTVSAAMEAIKFIKRGSLQLEAVI